jgi:hypothetical protein
MRDGVACFDRFAPLFRSNPSGRFDASGKTAGSPLSSTKPAARTTWTQVAVEKPNGSSNHRRCSREPTAEPPSIGGSAS